MSIEGAAQSKIKIHDNKVWGSLERYLIFLSFLILICSLPLYSVNGSTAERMYVHIASFPLPLPLVLLSRQLSVSLVMST